MAGVLACGAGAVLSHASAAALWDLHRSGSVIDVTAINRRMSRRGLRVHESELPADERTVCESIPVTTVARTLLDLAGVVPRHRLEAAVHEAERRGFADAPALPELLTRYPGRRGVAAVRDIVAEARLGVDVPRSELEERFLAFLRRRGLPAPEVNSNVEIDGRWYEIDCLWRAAALAVELDGHAWHADARAYEADRLRDRKLVAANWSVVRVTWRQLHREVDALERDLRAALNARTAS